MHTALCISGELRRAELFFPAIEKHILEPYNPDVFISTWNMPDNIPTSKGNTQRNPAELITHERMIELYQPTGLYVQQYSTQIKDNLKSVGNTPTDNLMCMAFHINTSIELASSRYDLTCQEYDLIIRYRFDYAVDIRFENYDLTNINLPKEHGYGGYQDQFAFGNYRTMLIYGEWWTYLPHIENQYAQTTGLPTCHLDIPGMPWHPESALKRYLDSRRVPINLFENVSIRYPWCTKEEVEELHD